MINYRVATRGEAELLERSADDVLERIRGSDRRAQEIQALVELLRADGRDIEALKAQSWFKKSWALVSGKRGELRDQSINNLGKVQLICLRVVSDILRDNTLLGRELVDALERVDAIDADNLAQKELLLAFNAKYRERFSRLERRQHKQEGVLGKALVVVALCFAALGALLLVPSLLGSPYVGVGLLGAAVVFLVLRLFLGRVEEPKRDVIRVTVTSDAPTESPSLSELGYTGELLGLSDESYLEPAPEPVDVRVFKVEAHTNDLLSHFTLEPEEQRLLFSLQHYVTAGDVDGTTGEDRARKARWLHQWTDQLAATLEQPLVTEPEELGRGLAEVATDLPRSKLAVIALETALFAPYFSLDGQQRKKPLVANAEPPVARAENVASALGIPYDLICRASTRNAQALKEIPPSTVWRNAMVAVAIGIAVAVTGGAAAPFIGAAIGAAMGLSGAAAVSAGLAFLGGGALAAGGLGMAGGTAVVIGGGAILGASLGGGVAGMLHESNALVLRELAKLESIAVVLLPHTLDIDEADQVVKAIVNQVEALEQEFRTRLAQLANQEGDDVKREIGEIEKSLACFPRAVARLRKHIEDQ